jgi:hypothetical protein
MYDVRHVKRASEHQMASWHSALMMPPGRILSIPRYPPPTGGGSMDLSLQLRRPPGGDARRISRQGLGAHYVARALRTAPGLVAKDCERR